MPWTYILRCADDSTYCGSTWDIERRLQEHQSGRGGRYTSHRLPVTLAFAHYDDSIAACYSLEKRIQGWSRAKREALIRGDFDSIALLAKKQDWGGYRARKEGGGGHLDTPPPSATR